MSYPSYPQADPEVHSPVSTFPEPTAPVVDVVPTSSTGLQVNPAFLTPTAPGVEGREALPPGLFWADQDLPAGREELFRVNGRVYTVPTQVPPKVVFRQMRRLRRGASEIQAAADLMYDVLGDAVMDFLADEDLSDPEYEAVGDAITKYVGSAARLAGLGKSPNGPTR